MPGVKNRRQASPICQAIKAGDMTNTPLPPGSTIGIFGGGQLGRMTALAAAELGYRVHIFDPQADPPAAQTANFHLAPAYDDQKAVAKFAAGIDVATFEFENVPSATVARLEDIVPVRPGGNILHIILLYAFWRTGKTRRYRSGG